MKRAIIVVVIFKYLARLLQGKKENVTHKWEETIWAPWDLFPSVSFTLVSRANTNHNMNWAQLTNHTASNHMLSPITMMMSIFSAKKPTAFCYQQEERTNQVSSWSSSLCVSENDMMSSRHMVYSNDEQVYDYSNQPRENSLGTCILIYTWLKA